MIPVEYTKHNRIVHILLLMTALVISGCRPSNTLPGSGTREYTELVRTFYIGLAALQVGHDVQADSKLAQFTQLAASEPAGWANWGLLALRQRNFDTANERLERARSLAPDNSDIQYLIGLLESSRGRSAEAIAALRKAVELDAKNLFAVYKLAEELERLGDDQSTAEVQSLLQKILTAQPGNVAAPEVPASTAVVTPRLRQYGSGSMPNGAPPQYTWVCRSTQPGVTMSPRASRTSPRTPRLVRSAPIAAMR